MIREYKDRITCDECGVSVAFDSDRRDQWKNNEEYLVIAMLIDDEALVMTVTYETVRNTIDQAIGVLASGAEILEQVITERSTGVPMTAPPVKTSN